MTLAVRTTFAVTKSKFSGKILNKFNNFSRKIVYEQLILVNGKLMGFSWRSCDVFFFLFLRKLNLRFTKRKNEFQIKMKMLMTIHNICITENKITNSCSNFYWRF